MFNYSHLSSQNVTTIFLSQISGQEKAEFSGGNMAERLSRASALLVLDTQLLASP